MDLKELVNPLTTSLLVIDIQNDYCSREGKLPQFRDFDTKPIEEMIPKLGRFIEDARKYKVPVVWTQMIEDHTRVPENLRVKMESFGHEPLDLCIPGTWGYEFYSLKPDEKDTVFSKNRYNAFTNPKLDKFLRSNNVENVIITGVLTSRCVRATVQGASERNYHVVVPKDLVGMYAEQSSLHQATLTDIGTIYAHLTTLEEIVKAWREMA